MVYTGMSAFTSVNKKTDDEMMMPTDGLRERGPIDVVLIPHLQGTRFARRSRSSRPQHVTPDVLQNPSSQPARETPLEPQVGSQTPESAFHHKLHGIS